MYTLFATPRGDVSPRYSYQSMEAVRRRWLENIFRLQSHWRTSGVAVASEHVLSRLIGSFSIPLYDDVRKYRDAILDFTPRLCMGQGIVAPTNGSLNQQDTGWFYGLKGREFLVSVTDDFDPVSAAANWETLEPLRVIRHTLNDLNMALPTGDVPDVYDGYVVIAINIPLLAVQYWGWVRSQVGVDSGMRERTQQFIGQYVLPSLLPSQTTVAWFNRILGTFNGTQLSRERKVNSLAIATNYTNVDRVIGQILNDFKINRMGFTELMSCIPTVGQETMVGFLQTPDTVIARQNQWALELAYVPYASLAAQLSTLHKDVQNQQERNRIYRLNQLIKNDRLLDAAPSSARAGIRLDYDLQVGIWSQ